MTGSGVRASLPLAPWRLWAECPGTRRFLEARPLWAPRFDTERMRNNYRKMEYTGTRGSVPSIGT